MPEDDDGCWCNMSPKEHALYAAVYGASYTQYLLLGSSEMNAHITAEALARRALEAQRTAKA